jgi:hypothetical protein
MATDAVSGIYTQVCALLTTHATSIVRLVRYDEERPYPQLTNVGVGDLPECEVDYEGGEDSGFLETLHYGDTESTVVASDSWVETGTHNFVLVISFPDFRIGTANTVVEQVKLALRKGGPCLGLSYVQQWGPVSCQHDLDEGDGPSARGSARRIVTLRFPVQTVLHGQNELS